MIDFAIKVSQQAYDVGERDLEILKSHDDPAGPYLLLATSARDHSLPEREAVGHAQQTNHHR
jgi:hypothetical protein